MQATTRLVQVEVVVRDGNGRLVRGLSEQLFRVAENGKPQHITAFEEHTAAQQQKPGTDDPAQAHEYANVASLAPGAPLDLVLFDLLNTPSREQGYARARMIAFLKALPPHRQVALFVLGNKLRMIQGFTTESQVLTEAANRIDLKELDRVRSAQAQIADQELAAVIDRDAGRSPSSAGERLLKYALSDDIVNMQVRLDETRVAFRELARAVNGYPGRKNLYWLAGQFPGSQYYELQAISATAGSRQESRFADANAAAGQQLSALDTATGQAMVDSQMAVYPISLTGVQTDSLDAQFSGASSIADAGAQARSTLFNDQSADRAIMNNIAQATGGEAFYGNNDPKLLLQRGFEDGDNYYTLSYEPQDRNFDSRFRSIKVALSAGGYELSYRRGYFAFPVQPVEEISSSFARAMRIEAPVSTMLQIRSGAPVTDAAGQTTVPATLVLQGVRFAVDPATQLHSAKLQLTVAAYPETGEKTIEANNLLKLVLQPKDFRTLSQNGLPLRIPITLPPGRYAIRVGVVDLGSGRIGTLTMPYSVPPAQ